jgi:serine/threonine-protein kinase
MVRAIEPGEFTVDPFETRLQSLADRHGWDPAVVAECKRRRSQLVSDPPLTASEIAEQFELPDDQKFELQVMATRQAPSQQPGTRFEKNAPPAVDWDEDTAPAPAKSTGKLKRVDIDGASLPATVAPSEPTDRTISGTTLKDAFHAAHAEPSDDALRTLIAHLAAVAATVGNAHRHGVVVRNLAPDNILLGELGEVVFADPKREPTPAYFSPEQARDPNGVLSPTSDVFGLGALLFEALTDTPLFAQVGREATLKAIVDDERRPLESPFEIPAALQDVLRRATHGAPGARHPNGTAFAVDLDRWLFDVHTGHPSFQDFANHLESAAQLRHSAVLARAEAVVMLSKVDEMGRIEEKEAAWAKQTEAAGLDRTADQLDREYRAALERELAIHPTDAHVRKLLCEHLQARHKSIEADLDRGEEAAAPYAERLQALAPRKYSAYLAGEGRLTLHTDPPGATVELYRYELKDRRLWPTFVRDLGKTPLDDVRLGMGSYVCILRHPQCADVRYPVVIHRRTHWHGRGPDATGAVPIVLPRTDTLGENTVYVPAGWFQCGGPEVANAMPSTWSWCDGFVIQKDPVNWRVYTDFLDALARSRDPELEACLPRSRDGHPLVHARNGVHSPVPGPFGKRPDLEWPVTNISWSAANTFARWYSQLTDTTWRLPADVEWEKAARGVDGRVYPWGDFLDPQFAAYGQSQTGVGHPRIPTAFPSDSSPYGVRGMAGNVRDWCRDSWMSRAKIAVVDEPPMAAASGPKVVRGGHFQLTGPELATWLRARVDADSHEPWLGFRLVRRFPG